MKILVAESDAEFSRFLSSYFIRKKHNTECVANEKDAMSRLSSFDPEVVISAVDLEDGSGYNLCNFVKSNVRLKDTIFVLIFPEVAHWPAERTREIIKKADVTIRKPFKPEQLEEMIRKRLSMPQLMEQVKIGAPSPSKLKPAIKPEDEPPNGFLDDISPGSMDEAGAEAFDEPAVTPKKARPGKEDKPPELKSKATSEFDEQMKKLDEAFDAIQLNDNEVDFHKELTTVDMSTFGVERLPQRKAFEEAMAGPEPEADESAIPMEEVSIEDGPPEPLSTVKAPAAAWSEKPQRRPETSKPLQEERQRPSAGEAPASTVKFNNQILEKDKLLKARDLEIAGLKARIAEMESIALKPAQVTAEKDRNLALLAEIAKLKKELDVSRQAEEKLKKNLSVLQTECEEKVARTELQRIEEVKAARSGSLPKQTDSNAKLLSELKMLRDKDAAQQEINTRIIKALQIALSLLEKK